MFHAGKAYARGSVLGLTYSAASAVAFNMVTGFISSGPAHDVKLALTAGALGSILASSNFMSSGYLRMGSIHSGLAVVAGGSIKKYLEDKDK